ncbi:rhodanese-like domain-containing protein [uncultured Lutibacter sp.]|mgnify:CR=1 FL=1|uniref:rhodanese-like domain-containing protein n=1 Tax=uncultured Lutibacter sp. TaxID=437739 RepID=UPI002611C611|nr:rhodanese-like domain-containing protein [uncultured Lutibacter sp.]
MKKRTNYFVLLLFITTLLVSYNSNAQDTEQTTNSEFELLVEYLEANGNFINSELAPAVVLASEIKDNLKNSKYLVLDIRSEGWFDYGHIKNATNIKAEELLNYFENEIDPKSFDKITIVCYSGQSAAYYAGLLRLAGYNNVFNLKWGMSSWDEEFATNIWLKNSKDTYIDKLETTSNEMSEVDNLPILNTGKTTGEEILKERIKEVFAKPYKEFIVKVDSAFTSPNDFYIVNYVSEENHNFGHIPGAVRYQPSTSLSSTSNLYTLPTDKNILVNCETGFSGAFTVAYLNILGYKASNLAYGSNSFMNSVLIEKGWNGFSDQEVNSYPISE